MKPMSTPGPIPLMTAEELMRTGGPKERIELWEGLPVVKEGHGGWAGPICTALSSRIYTHVRERRLGYVGDSMTPFVLARAPDWVCIPDVSYVSRARFPVFPKKGFVPGAPDLAVEVRSPSQAWARTLERGGIWIAFGAALVWCIDPVGRRAVTMRGRHCAIEHEAGDTLSGDPVLPDLQIPIAELFSDFE